MTPGRSNRGHSGPSPAAIKCAGCGSPGPCRCLICGPSEAIDLVGRAARGARVAAPSRAWLRRERDRAQQRDDEQAEFHRAATTLRRRAGGSYGPAAALRWLLSFDTTGAYSARGCDADVQRRMRERGEWARLEHIAWARAWIATRWLRDVPTSRRLWEAFKRRTLRSVSRAGRRR